MIKMGCKHHSDCNTCPFDDCVSSVKSLSKKVKSEGNRKTILFRLLSKK